VTSTYRGAYAERLVVPARNVVPVRCSPVAAALVEPFAVGLHAVRRAGVGSQDQVAVLGAGMIGLACAVCATNDGAAAVYVGDLDPTKVQRASKLGATGLVLDGQRLPAALRALGVAGVDRAIDAIGLPQTLTDALEVVRRDGVVCLVGMASPEAGFPTYSLVTEERTLLGTFCYSAAHFQESARLLENGTVDVDMFVDAQITLEEAPDAFRALATRERSSVKTIVRP
jgi:threonine dehydrogenase-like Zn-dependent dehydrogenase